MYSTAAECGLTGAAFRSLRWFEGQWRLHRLTSADRASLIFIDLIFIDLWGSDICDKIYDLDRIV